MTALIETENLGKRYGRARVLNGMALAVDEGSIYGLVGPNGAGKTTTVKILMNILEPSDGRAVVLDADTRRLGPRHFQQIGYVSENQQMPDWMTVRYFMDYLKPFYPRWDDARAATLLRQLDLPLDRKLGQLSRGMRMKASLASVLAYHPRLLVLDEPFSGLDPLVRDEFIEGLLESAEETTMLISSHDLAEIESFATHIGFLDQGRLRFSESMTALSDRFREIEVTVDAGAPVTMALPPHWLRVERAGSVVRFVDSQYDTGRSMTEARRLFGEHARVSANAMSLRAIFVTLARESRKAA
jgi:ABC-2 type transport system ATP-binding protein